MLQELVQQIENVCSEKINEVHTALPGSIVSFNPNEGTAVVQPAGKFVTPDNKKLSYPKISEVPVVFPFCQSINAGIAFPVKSGDDCLIIVSEVELDEWRSGGASQGSLKFDLTSACCIPGLLNGGAEVIAKATNQNAVIAKAGDNTVTLKESGIYLDTGSTQLTLTDSGAELSGNLRVKGSIFYSGVCQRG